MKPKIILFLSTILITINLWSQPQPNSSAGGFATNDTIGCAPYVVNFHSIIPNGVSWNWNFGNGNTSIMSNPVEIYANSGIYTVTLDVVYADGTTNHFVRTNYIDVASSPSPTFSVNQLNICEATNHFQFQNNTLGNNQYLWDFGDGNTSTDVDPTHHYNSSGNYNVMLFATNANGCFHNTSVNNIIVHPTTQNSFTLNGSNQVCDSNFVFSFSALPNGMTNYTWLFSNGTQLNNQNIQQVFNASGTFDVTLITEDTNGCIDSTYSNDVVEIISLSNDFYANDTISCASSNITFTTNADGASNITWDFGDGNQGNGLSVNHSYGTIGNYAVTLTIDFANGCSQTIIKNNYIEIIDQPSATIQISNTLVCKNETVFFNIQNTNAQSVKWFFGDGSTSLAFNTSHTYNNAGQYESKLVLYRMGCSDTLYSNIIVQSATAGFQNQTNHICAPADVLFLDLSTNAISWEWSFSNGSTSSDSSPTITFDMPGNYDAQLVITDINGCTDTSFVTDAVQINSNQSTSFQSTNFNGCAPLSITLYNFVSGSGTWVWNFGDGNYSYDSIPNHIYNDPGEYIVSLSTTDYMGCNIHIDTFALVTVNSLVIDSINIELKCSDSLAIFSAYCDDCASSLWSFGDNTFSNNLIETHSYNADISYYVSFNGISSIGCSSSILYSVNLDSCTVNSVGGSASSSSQAETAGWSSSDTISERDPFYSFCGPISILVNNPVPNAQTWEWHFGDGNTGFGNQPTHDYQNSGVYSLMLVYTDSTLTDTLYFNNFIEVLGHENEIVINSVNTCNGLELSLLSQNTSVMNYFWSIDNTLIQNNTPALDTTLLSNNHLYSITLTTVDTNFCSNSESIGVISEGITPSFSYNSPICLGDSLIVSHDIQGYSRKWIFGDGTLSASPFHIYSSEGVYDLSIELTDKFGCVKIIEIGQVSVINPVSNFEISLTDVCKGDTIFLETSIHPNNAYNWTIGNYSFVSNDSIISYIPILAGVFDVSLMVSQAHCVDTSTLSNGLTVNQAVANFNFTQDSYCLPITAQYNDLSQQAVSWSWNFGDGNTSVAQHPSNIFSFVPTSQVTLQITDVNGCKATKSRNNIELFNADVLLSSANGCAPAPIEFNENSQNPIHWFWNFGDGNTSTLSNPIHIYQNEGIYDITLVVTSADGCIDSVFNKSAISIDKVIADFSLSNPSGCAPQPVFFTNNSYNAVSYQWNFGNGFMSTSENPIQVYHTGGNYITELIVQSISGCKDTLNSNTISVMGPSSNFAIVSNSVCDYENIEFINLSQNALNYSWTFGDGTSSNNANPTHQYDSSGTYNVSLICSDINGCQNIKTLPTEITVIPTPSADFTINDTIGCSPLQMNAISNNVGQNYSWLLNGIIHSNNSIYNSQLTTGSYELILIISDQNECKDTSNTIEILVHESYSLALPSLNNICETQNEVIINDTSSLGNWYLNGVLNSNNIFDVSSLQPGEHIISKVIDGYCGVSDTIVFQIDSMITASINSLITKCEYDEEFQLFSSSNLGHWSGPGVINPYLGIVNPSYANYGDNQLSYIILNGACTFNDSTILTVFEKPNSNFTVLNEVNCEGQIIKVVSPQNPSSANYTWIVSNENDTTTSNDVQPILYFTPDTVDIFLSVENNGCISVDSVFNIKVFDLVAPNSPEIIRSTVENNHVLTEWENPLYGAEKVTGYQILRATDSLNFSVIDWVSVEENSYIDINTNVHDQNYYYLIVPTNVCDVTPETKNMSSSILLEKNEVDGDYLQFNWTDYYKWDAGVEYYELQIKNKQGDWIILKKINPDVNTIMIEKP